jgi:hypothetical protein|tara:strand:+ start:959 stop:1111 length:153 start_codon:yes stop_codon:yes gene_type:complete
MSQKPSRGLEIKIVGKFAENYRNEKTKPGKNQALVTTFQPKLNKNLSKKD